MKNLGIVISAAVLSISFAAGCKRQGESAATQTTAATDQTQTQTRAGTPTPLHEDDKEFIEKAAQSNLVEIAAGQHVSRAALSPEVKAFGEQLATDHGKAHEELKRLAGSKGVMVATVLDEDHREDVADITKLSAGELDEKYIDEMIDEHEDDVEQFRKAAREAKDPEVRAYAAKNLPILEQHLATAKSLKAKMER